MAKILIGISDSFCAGFIAGQPTYFKSKGNAVVIISGPGEEISHLSKKEDVFLYNIEFSKRITPFYDLVCLWRVIKILKKEKPDIINASNPKSGLLLMLAAFLCSTQVRIFTMHGLPSDAKKGINRWLITMMEKLTCKLANKVIVVSPSLYHHALKRNISSKAKMITLNPASCNGLNTAYFKSTETSILEAKHIMELNDITTNDFVIGYSGRINYDKGITILINAFLEIVKKYPNVKLLLVGPIQSVNPIPDKYNAIIANHKNIIHLGKISNMPAAYECMDILVLPSFREGFGYALIEAAAMEKPVIASNIPGCQDAVLVNKNGFLFEKGNTKALLALFEFYYNNQDVKKEHGKNGRIWVSTKFNQQQVWSQIHSVLQSLGNK